MAGVPLGGGYYDYPEDSPKHIWPKLYDLFYKKNYVISDEDIQDRILFRQIVESLKCLEEGILTTSGEANIGSIMGIGFPKHTGGVFQAINAIGLQAFNERLNILAERYGERFQPPQVLLDKIKENNLF